MKLLKIFLMTALFASTSSAYAYNPNGQIVTIATITQWEGNGGIIFTTTDGYTTYPPCYIPTEEKNLTSMVMMMKATGKSASIHCYDSGGEPFVTPGGGKVHRLILQ